MNEAIVFGFLQNLEGFFLVDAAGFASLNGIVSHIAELDAPVIGIIRASFAQMGTRITAGAKSGAQMAIVFLKPIGDVFQINGLIAGIDFFFDWDDVHTDAISSRRNHLGDTSERNESHTLKERGDGWCFVNAVFGGVEKLRAPWNEEWELVAADPRLVLEFVSMVVIVAIIVFENAAVGHRIENFLKFGWLDVFVHLDELLKGIWLTKLHLQSHVAHFISEHFA